MPSGSPGINKPFDRILKSFADEAPVLFLHLSGLVPFGVEADIQPLRPETAPAMVLPDYVAVVRTGPDAPILFHAEFQTNYHHEVPREMARYGGSLAWQHQLPVKSLLVMLHPDRAPAEIPEVGHYSIGDTVTIHPFKVVRLWEIDPAPVLETNNPKLLPWAVLMKSSDEQVREIATIVARQDDDEAAARFLTLGSIRYDRDALNEMLGGGKMGLVRAILDGSSIVREEREQAVAEGRAEGRVEGRTEGHTEEIQRFLRRTLKKKFPELVSLAEIDQIRDVDSLETLTENVFEASNAGEIRDAILAAAKSN